MNNGKQIDRNEQARTYLIAILTVAYRKPDFISGGRVLEVMLIQQMQRAGFSSQETLSAIMYLKKMGRIDLDVEVRESEVFGKKIKNEWKYYSLSEASLNEIEGRTRYTRKAENQVVITNQSGNLVIGNNNVVGSYNTYEAIFNDLEQAAQKSSSLTSEQKQETKADVQTIKAQLSKRHPNTSIIKTAWSGLQFLSTAEGVTQFFNRAKEVIEKIIS